MKLVDGGYFVHEGFEVRLRGPSFLPGCVEPHAGGHILRLPLDFTPALGPAIFAITFEGFPQRFTLRGTVTSSYQRGSVVTAVIRVAPGDERLRGLLDFVRGDPRAPRCAPRYPLGVLVHVSFERSSRPARIHDVSATGCFLQIPGPYLPDVGTRVRLDVVEGVPVDAEVVRSAPLAPRGIGVRFTGAAEPTRAQVRRWVTSAMASLQQVS
jgi:hypothetical protein